MQYLPFLSDNVSWRSIQTDIICPIEFGCTIATSRQEILALRNSTTDLGSRLPHYLGEMAEDGTGRIVARYRKSDQSEDKSWSDSFYLHSSSMNVLMASETGKEPLAATWSSPYEIFDNLPPVNWRWHAFAQAAANAAKSLDQVKAEALCIARMLLWAFKKSLLCGELGEGAALAKQMEKSAEKTESKPKTSIANPKECV